MHYHLKAIPALRFTRKKLSSASALVSLFAVAVFPETAPGGPTGCIIVGNVATCQGNQSAGITNVDAPDFTSPPVDTLVVNGLTQDITPVGGAPGVGGVPGISFINNDNLGINIDVNTGAFKIDAGNRINPTVLSIEDEGEDDAIRAIDTGDGGINIKFEGTIVARGGTTGGIYARDRDAGDIVINSIGDITTLGTFTSFAPENSSAIQAIQEFIPGVGGPGFVSPGNITINSEGDLSTKAQISSAIRAEAGGAGNIVVNSIGDITVEGAGSVGIATRRAGTPEIGSITITSVGNITATATVRSMLAGDAEPEGISAINFAGGAISIQSAGDIVTNGLEGDAIRANNRAGAGEIRVVSRGNLTTNGARSEGVVAEHNFAGGDSSIVIDSIGNIKTTGNDSGGLVGQESGSKDVLITSVGDIDTSGDFSRGIHTREIGTGNTIINSTGNITTTGIGSGLSGAISVISNRINFDSTTGGDVSVTSIGNISTSGNRFNGVKISNEAGDGQISVASQGSISTSGQESHGVFIENDGLHDALISNDGLISTTGQSAHGVVLDDSAGGDITFIQTGNIMATGVNAFGIQAISRFIGTHSITLNNGMVQGNEAGVSFSESVSGATTILNNLATIDATSGIAISGGVGNEWINNAGTIIGSVNLGGGTDTLNLLIAGTFGGTADLGSGNDRLIFEDGFVITGNIDGGDGTDTIQATVNGGDTRIFDLAPLPLDSFEVIEKNGAGTLTIASTPTFGPILLQANGGLSQTSADVADLNVEVNSGATFTTDHIVGNVITQGTGRFQGTGATGNFTNNGVFAPGNSIGTVNVMGDLVLGPGGLFEIEIGPMNNADLVNVSGTTTLGGTLQVNGLGMLSAFSQANQYTIIDSAGLVTGGFSSTLDNLPDLDAIASVVDGGDGGQEVQLNLVAVATTPSGDPTSSGTSTPNLSDKSIHPNAVQAGTDAGSKFIDILQTRARSSSLGNNSSASSTFALALVKNQPRTKDHPASNTSAFSPESISPEGRFAWFTGYNGTREVDGSNVTIGYDSDVGGFAAGIDHVLFYDEALVTLGLAGGYSATQVESGISSADVENWHVGVYSNLEQDAWRLSAAATYGFQNYDFTRIIPVGLGTIAANGATEGSLFATSVAASYNIAPLLGLPEYSTRFAPIVRFDHVNGNRDEFVETGAGILNLTVADDNFSRNYVSLGLETSADFYFDDRSLLRPSLEVRWKQAFGDDQVNSNSAITRVAGANFTTIGAIEDRTSFAIGAGLEYQFSESFSANVRYDGHFASGLQDHRATAGLRLQF